MTHVLRPDTAEAIASRKLFHEVATISKMPRDRAEVYIDLNLRFLTPEQKRDMLELAVVPVRQYYRQEIQRSKLYAILWTAGATWSQVGTLFGVVKTSAATSASRHLSPAMRQSIMGAKNKIGNTFSNEVISAYYEILNELCDQDPGFVVTQPVRDIAALLLSRYKADIHRWDDNLEPVPQVPPDESQRTPINWDELLAKPDPDDMMD